MSTDESTPHATATQEPDEAVEPQVKPRRGKVAAIVVAGVLLVTASSFGASMAGAAMAGDKGPDGAPSGAAQTECPDGPPAGMGS